MVTGKEGTPRWVLTHILPCLKGLATSGWISPPEARVRVDKVGDRKPIL